MVNAVRWRSWLVSTTWMCLDSMGKFTFPFYERQLRYDTVDLIACIFPSQFILGLTLRYIQCVLETYARKTMHSNAKSNCWRENFWKAAVRLHRKMKLKSWKSYFSWRIQKWKQKSLSDNTWQWDGTSNLVQLLEVKIENNFFWEISKNQKKMSECKNSRYDYSFTTYFLTMREDIQ